MNKTTAITKQETLLYALAAAGIIIVLLLGTIVYLVSSRDTATGFSDIPGASAPSGIPGAGAQQAPPLSPGQIENSGGQLPQGHVPVGENPAAGSGGAAAPQAAPEGESSAGEKGSAK